MDIIYGELLLAVGAILFLVVLIGTRNPEKPIWVTDVLLEIFYPVVVTACLFFGFYLIAKGLFSFLTAAFDLMLLIQFISILAATLFVIRHLKVRQRLDKFKAQAKLEIE